MENKAFHIPIADLHCDLLVYLVKTPGAHINSTKDIGVTLPYLKAGNVRHQVLAIYAPTGPESVALAQQELEAYLALLNLPDFYPVTTAEQAQGIPSSEQIGVTIAIENASVFCEEKEPLERAFQRFDAMLEACGHFFYIGFTHHYENRFGGGNYSNGVGLKEDGKRLLEYMNGKGIAVDLAHTSDQLACGIINHIDAKSLDIPVIASHSNFRSQFDHVRNLPDELVREVVQRKGLIGMNFLRAYIHPTDPSFFLQHFLHGLQPEMASDQLAFGADFFYRPAIKDPKRKPLFFQEHEDAGKYPIILEHLRQKGVGEEALKKLSFKNVMAFIERNW